jgi:hypothetical protein
MSIELKEYVGYNPMKGSDNMAAKTKKTVPPTKAPAKTSAKTKTKPASKSSNKSTCAPKKNC